MQQAAHHQKCRENALVPKSNCGSQTRVGFDPNEVGGKAFRVGGATDMRDVHGGHAQLLIKERGRWASDVAQLYQRALLSAQLDSSAGMAAAESRDLEEALTGWTQPATYYTLAAAA